MTSRFLISLAAMSLIAACGQSAPTAPKSPTPAAGGAEAAACQDPSARAQQTIVTLHIRPQPGESEELTTAGGEPAGDEP